MNRRKVAAAVVLVGLASSACASEPSSSPRAASPQPPPTVTAKPPPTVTAKPSPNVATAWERSPRLEPSGDIPVGEFNAYLESAEPPWDLSPLRSALEFLSLDDPGARTTRIVMETPSPEVGDEAVVTVTEDGLPDDSVGAVRYVLEFERQAGGGWRLLSAAWAQRCQDGRGHQDFTPELCI